MDGLDFCERVLHQPGKLFRRFVKKAPGLPCCCKTREEGGREIRRLLETGKPCMVCRFGSGELAAVMAYLNASKSPFRKLLHLFDGDPVRWTSQVKTGMCRNAGFFPPDNGYLDRFAELMLQSMAEIDILGSWLPNEIYLQDYLARARAIPLAAMDPYLSSEPWSEVLAGRKVLVVHPFAQSIEKQYARRERIFKDPRVLPEFELKTIPAVLSLAHNRVDFPDWFAALDYMCEKIAASDFDVALIGAGAYGLPLAARVKRMGKQAVHMGGATQILFGIRGRRWDERPDFKPLFNEYWVRPSAEETPGNASQVEGGTYW